MVLLQQGLPFKKGALFLTLENDKVYNSRKLYARDYRETLKEEFMILMQIEMSNMTQLTAWWPGMSHDIESYEKTYHFLM